MSEVYETYDRRNEMRTVCRTLDGRQIIVPPNKMFATPENIKRALDSLTSRLLRGI